MDSVFLHLPVARVFMLTCLCVVLVQGQKDPLTSYRADPRCWDSSSALLLEMRSPRIADTVASFWDLMVFLRSSENSKHTALFWDLAQVFWDLYVDCVLSRTHGLGRRHLTRPKGRITAMHSLTTDKSFRINSSSNFSRLKHSSQTWLGARLQLLEQLNTLRRHKKTKG